uniref:Uncharacterized protein n=1 Tax=Bursaphelenchus xylophilus TaxID=6326 RepID=A0A1I7RWX0_BURXY
MIIVLRRCTICYSARNNAVMEITKRCVRLFIQLLQNHPPCCHRKVDPSAFPDVAVTSFRPFQKPGNCAIYFTSTQFPPETSIVFASLGTHHGGVHDIASMLIGVNTRIDWSCSAILINSNHGSQI